jgi:hypothetical protein
MILNTTGSDNTAGWHLHGLDNDIHLINFEVL